MKFDTMTYLVMKGLMMMLGVGMAIYWEHLEVLPRTWPERGLFDEDFKENKKLGESLKREGRPTILRNECELSLSELSSSLEEDRYVNSSFCSLPSHL